MMGGEAPARDALMIAVEALSTQVCVGVSAEERARPQTLVISVALHLAGGASYEGRDALSETIDYDALIAFVREGLPTLPPSLLIETTAERVAAFALSLSPLVAGVDVRVVKPSVLQSAGAVSVVLQRRRP